MRRRERTRRTRRNGRAKRSTQERTEKNPVDGGEVERNDVESPNPSNLVEVGGGERILGKRSRSSSSDSPEAVEKTPCLIAYTPDGPVLYAFNFSGKNYKMRNLYGSCCVDVFGDAMEEGNPEFGLTDLTPPPSSKSRRNPNCSVAVALGSVVYVLGGTLPNPKNNNRPLSSQKVYYFNTNRPEEGWIQGPDMLSGRVNGKAVAVEGKIYVFAGNGRDKRRRWAEVLDPIENEWKPLPPLPDPSDMDPEGSSVMPAVYGSPLDKKKIFLGGPNYIYHVYSNSWQKLLDCHALDF